MYGEQLIQQKLCKALNAAETQPDHCPKALQGQINAAERYQHSKEVIFPAAGKGCVTIQREDEKATFTMSLFMELNLALPMRKEPDDIWKMPILPVSSSES